MSSQHSESGGLSKGWVISSFVIILAILWGFTDPFTAAFGTLVEVVVFSAILTPTKVR